MILVLVAAGSEAALDNNHLTLAEIAADELCRLFPRYTVDEVCLTFAGVLIGKLTVASDCEAAACDSTLCLPQFRICC